MLIDDNLLSIQKNFLRIRSPFVATFDCFIWSIFCYVKERSFISSLIPKELVMASKSLLMDFHCPVELPAVA